MYEPRTPVALDANDVHGLYLTEQRRGAALRMLEPRATPNKE